MEEWKAILRIPSIWVAILVSGPFFLFFTYTVNEGLIARQRIQLFPALLVLLGTAILQRRALNREEAKNSKMDSFLMSHKAQKSQREMV